MMAAVGRAVSLAIRQLRHGRAIESCRQRIAPAQDVVSRHITHYYYEQSYKAEEHLYWVHLPEWISELATRQPVRAALDVGCAYGTLLVHAMLTARCAGYAIDFKDTYLSRGLIEAMPIHFAVSNIELDPIPWPETFDLILFTEVLEHLNFQAGPTLAKLRDALSPAGRLLLSTPNSEDWGRNHKYYGSYSGLPAPHPSRREAVVDDHVWHFNRQELEDLLTRAGLRILRWQQSPGVGGRHFNVETCRAD
jgi:SAM-dependent methyltransferase